MIPGFAPFAEALDAYPTERLEADGLPRIWVPTTATVDLLEMMGYRFHSTRFC